MSKVGKMLIYFGSIKIREIVEFIDKIEYISKKRKEFYKAIIIRRYEIIKEVYNKINME